MTGEEEAVLKEYLSHNGAIGSDEDFEGWYLNRYEGEENDGPLQEHPTLGPGVEVALRRGDTTRELQRHWRQGG